MPGRDSNSGLPALQQAEALLSEPRRTLKNLYKNLPVLWHEAHPVGLRIRIPTLDGTCLDEMLILELDAFIGKGKDPDPDPKPDPYL